MKTSKKKTTSKPFYLNTSNSLTNIPYFISTLFPFRFEKAISSHLFFEYSKKSSKNK